MIMGSATSPLMGAREDDWVLWISSASFIHAWCTEWDLPCDGVWRIDCMVFLEYGLHDY